VHVDTRRARSFGWRPFSRVLLVVLATTAGVRAMQSPSAPLSPTPQTTTPGQSQGPLTATAPQPSAPTAPGASAPPAPASVFLTTPAIPDDQAFPRIRLLAGRSQVLSTELEVTRIAVTNPMVADATRVEAREILIDAKTPGITSLILWEGTGRRTQYDVVVEAGVPLLQAQLQTIFPGEDIHVNATDEAIVLSGSTSTNEIALKAAEIAAASSSKTKVINLLKANGGTDSEQVMLEVRFAEVDHTALMQVGASFLANRPGFQTGGSTQEFPNPTINEAAPGQVGFGTVGVPNGDDQIIHVPDFLNLFLFLRRDGLLAVIKALQDRGKFQSLAEPNLIAYNGQEASFLAGGEFPVPVAQNLSGQITIEFKEFGVRLKFRPTIQGDTIRLKVQPEVSTLDFSNGLLLNSFRIPALKTRRAETDVELRDGQSFAIAGLLNNNSTTDRQAVPLLSSLPIIGSFFRSRSDSAERTELLVLITPHLVRPLEPSEVPQLPIDPKTFIRPDTGPGPLLDGGGGVVDAPPFGRPREQRP
jgi:pilus assembly protein CpaC